VGSEQQHDATEEAIRALRALILSGERYRQVLSEYVSLGVTDTQAVSYLTVHGDRGQNELAADLGLSSSASTALVDRLEREGIAERYPYPNDRRRTLVRLTSRGHAVVAVSRRWLLAGLHDIPAGDHQAVAAMLRSIAARLSEQSREVAQGDEPAFVHLDEQPPGGGVDEHGARRRGRP
jgi:DNA-binding MarR family transcriptional regulator